MLYTCKLTTKFSEELGCSLSPLTQTGQQSNPCCSQVFCPTFQKLLLAWPFSVVVVSHLSLALAY